MKKIVLLLLSVALLLSATACNQKKPDGGEIIENSMGTVRPTVNAAVSRFIEKYNGLSQMTLHNCERTDALNVYSGIAYERTVTITDNTDDAANPTLHVSIQGGTTEEDQQAMFAVFADAAKALESSVSDKQIADVVQFLMEQTSPVYNQRVSGYLFVETYMPIVDIGTGVVACRIDIVANQYFVEE